jgi:hypothetical protein
LRHTFGTLAINRADPVSVQHWMGHANLQTTMRYLHFRQRDDEADLLSEAFEETGSRIWSRRVQIWAYLRTTQSGKTCVISLRAIDPPGDDVRGPKFALGY